MAWDELWSDVYMAEIQSAADRLEDDNDRAELLACAHKMLNRQLDRDALRHRAITVFIDEGFLGFALVNVVNGNHAIDPMGEPFN